MTSIMGGVLLSVSACLVNFQCSLHSLLHKQKRHLLNLNKYMTILSAPGIVYERNICLPAGGFIDGLDDGYVLVLFLPVPFRCKWKPVAGGRGQRTQDRAGEAPSPSLDGHSLLRLQAEAAVSVCLFDVAAVANLLQIARFTNRNHGEKGRPVMHQMQHVDMPTRIYVCPGPRLLMDGRQFLAREPRAPPMIEKCSQDLVVTSWVDAWLFISENFILQIIRYILTLETTFSNKHLSTCSANEHIVWSGVTNNWTA